MSAGIDRDATRRRHLVRLATVAFVRNGDDLLLMRHPESSDRFRGRWNGIGGHVEAGEDVRAAARRELREEAGIDLPDLRLRCVIHETGLAGSAYVVFVFVGKTRTRNFRAAAGLQLAWQPLAKLDQIQLVADLPELLPRILQADEPCFATQAFDGGDRVLSLCIDGGPAEGARV